MRDKCRAALSLPRSIVTCALLFGSLPLSLKALDPRDFAVEIAVLVESVSPQIHLQWSPGALPTGFTVSRKILNEGKWNRVATLPRESTGFVDTNVVVGGAYEYEVAESSSDGVSAYGYCYSGVEVPFPGARGRVVLMVDSTNASELAPELAELNRDLVGDGWLVLRHDVARTLSPTSVKALIRADYAADPANTKAVLLFGHVAVPYSGNINPDMHASHLGAWPADVFYGDMEGTWTDGSVRETSAEDPRNYNLPADGKFDQSTIPGRVALQVGRVDLSDLPAFAPLTEPELLRRYLQKNHRFRHKLFDVERRGIIRDNFGEIQGDAPATDAWRTFTSFFGPDGIRAVAAGEFFPVLDKESYLWAYGGGGGGYFQADGVGSTTDFAQESPKCVFYMLHGSYFGDWDATDDLLRAPLASSGYGLAAAWTGLPHWFLHHMALGETIGLSTLVVQNNRGLYQNAVNLSAGQVHVALMGDPTLRMHVVAPPAQLTAQTSEQGAVSLSWAPSPEAVRGYYVYRAGSSSGPFARLTRTLLPGLSFTDAAPPAAERIYMVRAVKLEVSGSGSYFNPSQGIFVVAEGAGQTNHPPTITPVPDQTVFPDRATEVLSFTVSDLESASGELSVSGTSSNLDLVPTDNIVIQGAGADRTVQITPAPGQSGVATIILTVTDGLARASQSFRLTVTAPGKIHYIRRESTGSVLIEFDGSLGGAYIVEASKDFLEWTKLGTGVTTPSTSATFQDQRTAESVCRFYRVHWE